MKVDCCIFFLIILSRNSWKLSKSRTLVKRKYNWVVVSRSMKIVDSYCHDILVRTNRYLSIFRCRIIILSKEIHHVILLSSNSRLLSLKKIGFLFDLIENTNKIGLKLFSTRNYFIIPKLVVKIFLFLSSERKITHGNSRTLRHSVYIKLQQFLWKVKPR